MFPLVTVMLLELLLLSSLAIKFDALFPLPLNQPSSIVMPAFSKNFKALSSPAFLDTALYIAFVPYDAKYLNQLLPLALYFEL